MTNATRAGERVGDYELLEVIESAASYDLYLAADHGAQRKVEIHLVSEEGLAQPGVVERLVRGANLAREHEHPALARVLVLCADERGIPFVVAEHLAGRSLRQHVVANPAGLPLPWVLRHLTPLVEAVAAGHHVGLCHSGIDCDHVALGAEPLQPARLRRRLQHRASPIAELAPELRAAARVADARSDVWALGAVFHVALFGAVPALSSGEVKMPPSAAALPAELCHVLARCLASAPEARPMDARVLRDTLWTLRERAQVRVEVPPTATVPSAVPVATDAPVARASVIFDPARPAAAARRTLVEFAIPRRVRRRRRSPLSDPALRSRDVRDRARGTLFEHAQPAQDAQVQAGAAAGPTDLVPTAADGAAASATAVCAAAESVHDAAVQPLGYAIPSGRFLDLPSKRLAARARRQSNAAIARQGDAPAPAPAEPAVAARPQVAPASVDAGAVPKAQQAPAVLGAVHKHPVAVAKPRPMGAKQERMARSIRVKARGDATKARARAKLGAAQGLVRGAVEPGAAVGTAGRPVGLAPQRAAVGVEAGAAHAAFRTGEARARFGDGTDGMTAAIARAGEHDARSQLRVELFTLGLCALVFFGIPVLCDPTHTRAQELFGEGVRLGLGAIAASAAIAAVQLWWLQATTRRVALWPAAAALKLLALLVCFLCATHLVPGRMLATLEQGARALLPWTAGVFYLALGLYGLSRTRYNAAQHAALGIVLSVVYGGSALGSLRVVHASLAAQRSTAVAVDIGQGTLAAARSLGDAPRPSAKLGAADHGGLEAELERLGDTSADVPAGRSGDGDEQQELRSVQRLQQTRGARTQRLEAIDKQLQGMTR